MGGLREHEWHVGYSSDEIDLVRFFYEPAMESATSYDRAVGYFSSRALSLIAGGIRNLYLRDGKMRLIASPALSLTDREAIRSGLADRDDMIRQRLLEYLDPERLTHDEGLRLNLLSGMIADGLLEVRIAVKQDEDGGVNLYHEKIGVFLDAQGDFITFIGSPNESWNGWVGNAESFAVHTSWGAARAHARHERDLFDRTWNGHRPRVPVFEFPEAVKEALFEKFPPRQPESPRPVPGSRTPRKRLGLPAWLQGGAALRPFQKEAINRWLEAMGRGVFAMATGTGKTVTALVAALQVAKAARRTSLLIVVSVPTKDLVNQWERNAREFGFDPICCHSDTSAKWPEDLDAVLQRHRFGGQAIDMVLTTADTMSTARFNELIAKSSGPMMFIADEMHSLGTRRRLASLPDAQYRLGLSATPQRHGDEEGTQELLDYFGPIHQQIGIREAIALGALVPYTYTPILVPLAADEMERYLELSAQIAAIFGAGADGEDVMERAGFLLVQRARLLGHVASKLVALEKLMRPLADSHNNLVYVAEGLHPLRESRQLDQVLELLGTTLGMASNVYTSDTPSSNRADFQRMLREGTLQALIAMRCLDEGIDIPEVRRGVILASTQNPRQFVQRRGRILRRDDAGGKTSAELYDMLVVPDRAPPRDHRTFRTERRLVGRELSRALELASASTNGADTPPEALVRAMEQYDLLELVAEYHQPQSWKDGGSNVYA